MSDGGPLEQGAQQLLNLAGSGFHSARRLFKARARPADLPPGTPVHIGERKVDEIQLTLFDYDESTLDERVLTSIAECATYRDASSVSWLNIDGLHDMATIEACGKVFGLHQLVLEDLVNTGQRPKFEDYDDYVFVVMKMLRWDELRSEVRSEQVSLVIGEGFLLSFQEAPGDVFDAVRKRVRLSKGRIRRKGPGYLAYALMSAAVEQYFSIMETIGGEVEALETEMIADPTPSAQQRIYRLKRETIYLRKSVAPLRAAVGALMREESSLIADDVAVYYRDLYDQIIHVTDAIETFRDTLSGLLDLYISSVSNKMNEVMKVLTIIATIFIPITFVAGVYGMNFEVMPELKWAGGYYVALGVMAACASAMVLFFKKNKWL